MKDFPIREELKLQFRAEAYNISNTPSWSEPALNIGGWAYNGNSASPGLVATPARGFGQVTSTISQPRRFQFALRLQF